MISIKVWFGSHFVSLSPRRWPSLTASCMCLGVRRVTSTAQTCTDWTWTPESGSTSNPTTHQTTCLRNGEHYALIGPTGSCHCHSLFQSNFFCLVSSEYTPVTGQHEWWPDIFLSAPRGAEDLISNESCLFVSQVQTWNSTRPSEDIHLGRRDFLDLLSSGQGSTPTCHQHKPCSNHFHLSIQFRSVISSRKVRRMIVYLWW